MKRLFLAAFALGLLIAPAFAVNRDGRTQNNINHDRENIAALQGRQADIAAYGGPKAAHREAAIQRDIDGLNAKIARELHDCLACH
jgi:hypothetical protein